MKTIIKARLLEPIFSCEVERSRFEDLYVLALVELFGTAEAAHAAYVAAIEAWLELGEYPSEKATAEHDAAILDWMDKNHVAVSIAFDRVIPDMQQFELTFRDVVDDLEEK